MELGSILNEYQNTRQQTEALCKHLVAEDFVVQPIEDVSPPKWHLGHTTWFFENFILVPNLKGYKAFNLDLNFIFNSYYESQGKRILRTNRGNLTRPTTEEVLNYRRYVDEHMVALLQQLGSMGTDLEQLMQIGIQHEMQHQELLLTDIKYILGHNPLFPALFPSSNDSSTPRRGVLHDSWARIPEGVYPIGYGGTDFCYDNELGRHQVFLHAFQIKEQLVTNAEYLEFMEDAKGYTSYQYWLADGWAWVKENKLEAPMYWHKIDGQWHYYTLYGLQPVDMAAPVVHISFYEAEAFARWKGKRLPTEFEWEVYCNKAHDGLTSSAHLMAKSHFQPLPPEARDTQLFGTVWEWTNSAYLPYPYYQQAEGALGEYNGKFMIDQMVLRGGACSTPNAQIRATYRNFFQASKQWQFSGIRLAEHL